MNNTEALDVLTLARWFGWQPDDQPLPTSDGRAADAFARLVARALEQPGAVPHLLEVFEAHCRRLRGTPEAEQVCEQIDATLGGDVIFDTLPGLTAAFDRWQQARQELDR